jgi:DNA invertase Pin-like site-specific DNA recombinase
MTRRYYSASRNRHVKQIVYLLDVEHLAPKEVARELGISVWTVYRANKHERGVDVSHKTIAQINAN